MTSATRAYLVVVATLTVATASTARAQDRFPDFPRRTDSVDLRPLYTVRTLPKTTVPDPDSSGRFVEGLDLLRARLRAGQWSQALRIYLHNYQPPLPAWIVYVDSLGVVSQGWATARGSSSMLHGEPYVWVMLFTDLPIRPMRRARDAEVALARSDSADVRQKEAALKTAEGIREHYAAAAKTPSPADKWTADSLADNADARVAAAQHDTAVSWATLRSHDSTAAVDTADLRLARRTILQQADPTLVALIKALGKTLSLDFSNSNPTFADSVKTFTLAQISADPTDSMWAGFQRFTLQENAVVELAVSPIPGKEFATSRAPGQIQRVYSNLANAKQHAFELGMLTGFTYGKRIPSYDSNLHVTSLSPNWGFDAYVAAFVNIPYLWWKVPFKADWQRGSIGFFGGTNVLTGSLGDKFVAGLSLGHVFGDAGVALGWAWLQEPKIESGIQSQSRQPRMFLGLDLTL